jgi:hypothetical protein
MNAVRHMTIVTVSNRAELAGIGAGALASVEDTIPNLLLHGWRWMALATASTGQTALPRARQFDG